MMKEVHCLQPLTETYNNNNNDEGGTLPIATDRLINNNNNDGGTLPTATDRDIIVIKGVHCLQPLTDIMIKGYIAYSH